MIFGLKNIPVERVLQNDDGRRPRMIGPDEVAHRKR